MEKRFLGRSGLQVSTLAFGLMTFGGTGRFESVGTTEVDDARRQIDIAIDAGVTLLDTADIYSMGRSEEILGEVLGEKRNEVLVATKVFAAMGRGDHDRGLSRHHIIAACEDSLRRLKTDWIDLYQVHNFDGLVPIEETLRALDDLVRAGKVRYIGCSNHFGWELTRAQAISERLGLERYISQQIQYSLMVRDAETEMLPAGVAQDVGALIWSPLAQGYLTGKFRSDNHSPTRLDASGRLKDYDDERGRAILTLLDEIAAGHPGATPGQVAINWLLGRPGVSSVIIGARTETQLQDNLGAANWRISPDEIAALDAASAKPLGYPAVQRLFFQQDRNPPIFTHVTPKE